MDLVTGGTGLVGSHLLLALIRDGHTVRATRRDKSNPEWVRKVFLFYEPDHGEEFFQRIEWVTADLNDPFSLEDIYHGVDRVFHAAAIVSFDPRDKKKLIRINRDGTRNMVNQALESQVSYFGFVSSVAALGRRLENDVYTVSENEEWKNTDDKPDYARSKFLSELEVWRGIEEGLPAGIVNPSVIIGPSDWNRGSGAIFRRIHKGLPFYPPGATGFVDVRDVVHLLLTMANDKITGERFIVSAENLTFLEMFTMIAEALGKNPPRFRVSRFMGTAALLADGLISAVSGKSAEITRHTLLSGRQKVVYDTSKVKEKFAYSMIPMRESVKNAVDFYKKWVIGQDEYV